MIVQRAVKRLLGRDQHLHETSDVRWLVDRVLPIAWGRVRVLFAAPILRTVRCGPHTFTIRGVMSGSTMERSFARYGCYEPALVEKVLQTVGKDDIVWDVGSGIGYYPLLLSRILASPSQIVCVETNRLQIRQFRRNFRWSSVKPTIVNTWIAGVSGDGATTLDDLCQQDIPRPPTVIKIDIEGAEVSAVEGAARLISARRPRLFIEIHPRKVGAEPMRRLDTLFGTLFEFYEVEYVRNHWGLPKGSDDLSWRRGTREELLALCDQIISSDSRPTAFMIHCYARPFLGSQGI